MSKKSTLQFFEVLLFIPTYIWVLHNLKKFKKRLNVEPWNFMVTTRPHTNFKNVKFSN